MMVFNLCTRCFRDGKSPVLLFVKKSESYTPGMDGITPSLSLLNKLLLFLFINLSVFSIFLWIIGTNDLDVL